MVVNVHFLLNEDGKKSIAQLPDNFSHKDFVKIISDLFGSNPAEHYTFVAKGKDLCLKDEKQFNERKKNITNGVNIMIARRMRGGEIKDVIKAL